MDGGGGAIAPPPSPPPRRRPPPPRRRGGGQPPSAPPRPPRGDARGVEGGVALGGDGGEARAHLRQLRRHALQLLLLPLVPLLRPQQPLEEGALRPSRCSASFFCSRAASRALAMAWKSYMLVAASWACACAIAAGVTVALIDRASAAVGITGTCLPLAPIVVPRKVRVLGSHSGRAGGGGGGGVRGAPSSTPGSWTARARRRRAVRGWCWRRAAAAEAIPASHPRRAEDDVAGGAAAARDLLRERPRVLALRAEPPSRARRRPAGRLEVGREVEAPHW